MDRIEMLEELTELEKGIKKAENMIEDLGSHYFQEVKLEVEINSKDYSRKTEIVTYYKPDKKTLVAFLETELNVKKNRARKILADLMEG